jgi:2-amino-4-hydroxy-6-hydroxymethyldihydropteridine diphosphokinase
MDPLTVYLSLGGNEGQVLLRLQQALRALSCQQGIANLKSSHFYQTAPIAVETTSWFVNAVCSFHTHCTVKEIFKITQAIEIQFGKVHKPKNASRPIDIDLLFYGQQICKDQELEIPHPHWQERLFVLVPLADLTNDIVLNREGNLEYYFLPDLIQPLLVQSPQAISLLEKNSPLR